MSRLLQQGKDNDEFHYTGSSKQTAQTIILLIEGGLLFARLYHDEGKLQLVKKQIKTLVT